MKRSAMLSPRWADVYFQEIRNQLEVALADRRYFTDLNQRLAGLTIDRYEFEETEKIHDDEVAAGWYTYLRDIARADVEAQTGWKEATKQTAAIFATFSTKQEFKDLLADPERAAFLRAVTAVASNFSAYAKVSQEYINNWEDPWSFLNMIDPDGPQKKKGEYVIPKFGTKKSDFGLTPLRIVPVYMKMYEYAKLMAVPELANFLTAVQSQAYLAAGAQAAAEATLGAKQITLNWNENDVGFRTRRTELAIGVNALRRKAMDDLGGPLNIASELASLRARFVEQLADIAAKASVLVPGFHQIWGWDDISQPPMPYEWKDSDGSYTHALAMWLLTVQSQLGPRMTYESSTVIPISIKARLSQDKWLSVLADAKAKNLNQLTFVFDLPASIFSPLLCARIRGISAYVDGPSGADSGAWRGRATIPANALVVTQSGNNAIAQSRLTSDLGRIQTRPFPKPADVVGISLLRNASPISGSPDPAGGSNWVVELMRWSSSGMDATDLLDMQLDLLVSGNAGVTGA
jgi:hypothetical protein